MAETKRISGSRISGSASVSVSKLATWGDHKFRITKKVLYGFEDLKIKASVKTKDKDKKSGTYGKQSYVEKENSSASEVSFTALLYATLGIDPQEESMEWLKDAQKGKTDRLIVGGKDVLPCSLMLTNAEVSDIVIESNCKWSSCSVKCTFKQSGLWDNADGTSGSGSSGHHSGHHSGGKSSSSGSSKKNGTVITIAGTQNIAGHKVTNTTIYSSTSTSSKANRTRKAPSVRNRTVSNGSSNNRMTRYNPKKLKS